MKFDQVLYLLHGTNTNPRKWQNKTLMPSKGFKSQFPGVYLSLITKTNLETEFLFPAKYFILYSASLLQQHNYHINIHDHNGIISEYNTYYPWNLDKALDEMQSVLKQKSNTANEVVFHDPIPTGYIVKIIKKPPNAYMYSRKDYLPTEQLISRKKPNLTCLPFYVYPMEHIYTGVPLPYKKSSLAWLRKIAKVADVSMNGHASRDDIQKTIQRRMAYLYKHRDRQNLMEFPTFALYDR